MKAKNAVEKSLYFVTEYTHTIYILVHYQCNPTVHHANTLFAALSDTSPSTNCFYASRLRGAGSTCYLLRRTSPDMHSSMYICQSGLDLRVTLPTPNPSPPQEQFDAQSPPGSIIPPSSSLTQNQQLQLQNLQSLNNSPAEREFAAATTNSNNTDRDRLKLCFISYN